MKREELPPREASAQGAQLRGTTQLRLLNDFQRGFPLEPRPFRALAAELDCDEALVLRLLREFSAAGRVSRVGAVFAPRRIGASTLAALAAPPGDLERIAALVGRRAEVNHNYEREHLLNLWFVATAADEAQLDTALAAIQQESGCAVVALPLLEEYHIDLGFDLAASPARTRRCPQERAAAPAPREKYLPTPEDRRLMTALQPGLELVPRPYARLAQRARMDEAQVLARIAHWLEAGLVKRFGVVVRHRELGFNANAMVVWDVPDERVSELGARLAGEPAVTLCYRRRRHLPQWPYNLFCMIHGRNRGQVEQTIAALRERHGLDELPGAVLFSRRCFKQQGAHYFTPPAAGHD